jgi:class 3 adenylate cyclase/tetratricopeptide (TPR) repeat protein
MHLGEKPMTFEEVLDQAMAMLQRRGRVSYRALKRQFALDDEYLEDLKVELIDVHQVAVDQDGTMLIWVGEAAETPVSSRELHQTPVLFADIKGSTELIAGLDPEAARQILDPVLYTMMKAVHRYEGTVNQVLGDGIMALFGAPLAHEDHAVRACYAALAMQEAMRRHTEAIRRSHGMAVQIRIGLNSGAVVVRAIGNDLHMDYSAIGQTTHLAARMEQLATPGSIVLTGETLRLVEGLVQVISLGPIPVKGMAEPMEVFELVGASPIRRRVQAAAARGFTRFVGRQIELETLYQALEHAQIGHGQIVAVLGEPGVGKSRLCSEFLQSPRTQGWLILESSSVSYGKTMPYLPVIDLLKTYFSIEDRQAEGKIREKVTGKLLTLDTALQPLVPAFLALLDVPVEDAQWQSLDASQRRQRTLEACKHLFLRESQVQPLLLVFENLQWIDSETQAFLDSLIDSLPTARILLLVTYRPEYQHSWGSKTYYTQLRLAPLSPESAEELLQVLLGADANLTPLKHRLIRRTAGNPFFLEESVRTLVETHRLAGERGHYRLTHSPQSIAVPATVQAVLAARIDRLPLAEKRLLQTAAVIGTDVPFPLLQAIAELSEEALRRGLTHLQAAEFLYETRLFPELEYTFKHALTHQVAYESLLQERRRALHRRSMEALEILAGDRLMEQIERLAHHALRGEVWEKALLYLRQAGEKAKARFAYQEAVEYCTQALETLRHLPKSQVLQEQVLALRMILDDSLKHVGDTDSVLANLREAEALAVTLGDHRRLAQVSVRMADKFRLMGDYERGLEAGHRALTLAVTLGDVSLQVQTNYILGRISFFLGNYQQAREVLQQSVASFAGAPRQEDFDPYSLSIYSRTWLILCLAYLGAFTEGSRLGAEAIQMAEAVHHPVSSAVAYYGAGMVSLHKGDVHQAIPRLERSVTLCQTWDLRDWFPPCAEGLGSAYALAGRFSEALSLLEQAMEQDTVIRGGSSLPVIILGLSAGYLLAGRLEEARPLAQQALARSRTRKEWGVQAWTLRLLGEIYLQQDPPDFAQAEDLYRQALTLANELGMCPLQAHCYRGLGTLYARVGRREQAYTALSTAIELYRSMEMTFWVPKAEETLVETK